MNMCESSAVVSLVQMADGMCVMADELGEWARRVGVRKGAPCMCRGSSLAQNEGPRKRIEAKLTIKEYLRS